MFKKVLVATDFSKHSEKIIDCVGEIPGVKDVVLLNVLKQDELARTWSPGDDQKKARDELAKPKSALEALGLNFKAREEPSASSAEYEVIERVANEENADLVVMGARGRGLLKGILLGSVSTKVLQRGTHNLLIMRYTIVDDGSLEKICPLLFSKILCPVDFSPAGMATINLLKNIDLPINVHLLSVIAKGESVAEIEARTKDAQEKLDAIKTDLMSQVKINVTSEVVTVGAGYRSYGSGGMTQTKGGSIPDIGGVEGTIMAKAEEIDASLIVLSSAGKGYLDASTVGSVVFDVARKAKRPVLVIRSAKMS